MAKSGNLFRIFSDESGSPDPFNSNCHNHGERIYTVVSIIIIQKEYLVFKKNLQALRLKYHKYLLGREIKSRSIRRSNPKGVDPKDPPEYDFWKFSEGQEQYNSFCLELKEIVKNTNFKIISASTDKSIAKKLYPHKNILLTIMIDLWERILIHHYLEKIKKSYIVFDPTGRVDDKTIRNSYQDFRINGSWFISVVRLKVVNLHKHIYSFTSESSAGIQLADYCAYPIKRYVDDYIEGTFFKEIIKPKLYPDVTDKKTGKRIKMGIKVSLNR